MKKSSLIIILFSLLGCSKKQVSQILLQDYSFLTEYEICKLSQSNDTLIEQSYNIEGIEYMSLNKIIETKILGEHIILKLKNLDSIPLNENLCPGKSYSVALIKNLNKNQLVYRHKSHVVCQNLNLTLYNLKHLL